jgi:hypothetical protein
MPDDDFKLLIESLAEGMGVADEGSRKVVRKLMEETLKFRDKLLEDSDQTLTVKDVRICLDALEQWLSGDDPPDTLSEVQKSLTKMMADTVASFGDEQS